MSEIETFKLSEKFPGYEEFVLIADSFTVGQNVTELGVPYMILMASVSDVKQALQMPMSADLAEKLGWSLIESAQKHRIIHGED